MLNVAVWFAFACVTVALALCAWRLARGPEAADRVLALDTLYVTAIAVLVLLGIAWATPVYFEAALIIALAGFVSTAALARFMMRGEALE
jgi:multicomponent K+:H+ antiporter subunit F